jgi:hypothetical protein
VTARFLSYEVPLFRELFLPAERRWWRCRPEPLGVRIEFRDAGEVDWGGRLRRIERTPERGENAVVAREAGLRLATAEALARVAEQLAEGWEDRSTPAGEQLWTILDEVWRATSALDPMPLLAATAALEAPSPIEVGRWLLALSATVGSDPPSAPLRWWPEAFEDGDRGQAGAALAAHARTIVPALLLSLRLPALAGAIAARDVLLAGGPLDEGPHGELAFEVVLDWLSARPLDRGEVPLSPSHLAAVLAPRPARIERLAHLVRSTPASAGVVRDQLVGSPEGYLAHGAGMEAALFLAGWSEVPEVVEALCALARERPGQTSWAVLRAAQRAPSAALREALRAARPFLAALGARYAAEVDAALKA